MEAAVVLPIIILVTITLVLMIMFLYSTATTQSHVHMALRYEAGKYTKHVNVVDYDSSNYSVEILKEKGVNRATCHESAYMLHEGVLRRKLGKVIDANWYCADGTKYVRRFNLK